MREPLEQAGDGSYDRPNQPWICGRSAEGDPCAFGPNARGVCPALAECQPTELNGQWQCDRPVSRGGACENGPTPDGKCCRSHQCQPVRNLRSIRGVVVRSLMVFAVGAVLMMLGSGWRTQWLAPGPLTSHHAQVLQGEAWSNRCASCHAAADQTPGVWLTALVGAKVGPTQSSKCLACHDKTIDPQLSLVAHNVPMEMLTSATGLPADAHAGALNRNLACSVCHQEHHGAGHAIGVMDNTRCQSCHTQKFDSFANDHPDFGVWPYKRRTPIAFSHATHSGKYFAEKNRTFACQQCHVEDTTRGVQLTLSYEAACAECHDADIATNTTGGLALLAMPSLDVDLLSESGHQVDAWPDRATGDFDGKPPAIMKWLLARNDKARDAIKLLGADFDFFDVDPDDEAQLVATADLATATNDLLAALADNDAERNQHVLRGLPPSVVAAARASWLAASPSESTIGENQTPQPGTWFVDPVNLSIRYQPTGHADPVLKAWIDAAVTEPDEELRSSMLAEFTGPGAPGRCTTCHSIESQSVSRGDAWRLAGEAPSSAGLTINWHAHDRRDELRGFTRFSHAPHLLPVELRDCTACHAMNLTADTGNNYTGHNAAAFVSDFHPISKASCAACHNKSAVGESCTQCHNYHVDAFSR